jgi:hypothetical protein
MSVASDNDPARPVEPGDVTVPRADAPSDNTTLVEVLAALRRGGYENSLTAVDDGGLRCSSCGRVMEPERLEVDHERRLEGASDPADEMLVLAGTCQGCGERAVLLLGFGPTASPADAAALNRLSLDSA